MSRQIILSLIGLESLNANLFADFEPPKWFTNEDMEAFKLELFSQTAEFELVYTDSQIMQKMIGAWSHRRKPIWDHLYDTTQYEYDPIKNWDRNEKTTDTFEAGVGGSDTTTYNNLKDATTGTYKNDVSGYNSDEYAPRDKSTNDGEKVTTGSVTNARTTNGTDTRTIEHVASGNVGTLTTQAMIKEEREIALFDLMQIVIDDFKDRFCLLVY